ncbi:MlaD family protein [Telluribacter sp.]|jgi:phospholipid/cholesterol/gamma-HCH transport system substrate-binding protein|uniref:MlaD family protein n=1 Tax=Telluribacter sp. TaxID=1978767 RepID=UPI002E12558E|nr:MlaD family protein [Telluribacter sp.]
METNKNKRAITVGLFIFLGLVVLVVGVLAIGSIRKAFGKKVMATAIFEDVEGLQAGNNVWFSGVKVGTVSKIKFSGRSQVEVTLNIEEKSQEFIRQDAKARISTDGLIGNKIVVIYGGTPKVPPIEDGARLAVEQTEGTEQMMKTLQENNRNILAITSDFKAISARIRQGEGSIGKLLNDESLYTELESTMARLQQASANAQRMSASLSQFTAKLNQQGSLAHELVTDTTIMPQVRSTMEQARNTMTQLNETAATADAMVADLKQTTEKLNTDTDSPVGVLLNDERAAADLRNTLGNLNRGSQRLDGTLEAVQSSFLFRTFFRNKAKQEEREMEQARREAAQKKEIRTDTARTPVKVELMYK